MEIKDIAIDVNATIIQTLKRMDEVRHKMLLVFKDSKFLSIITIGDIQRAIINNKPTNTPIEKIVDAKCKQYAFEGDDYEVIKNKMFSIRAEFMPVLDTNGNLKKVISWNEIFPKQDISITKDHIDVPVVIMAGGKGTRLKPLTNVFPKPLIPIGEKTILEEIMDRFENIGCNRFYMSVNYKYDIIEYYLNSLEHKYNISFFKEEKPLGTIGSVSLLKDKISTPFFVSNCDIIIDQDFRDVYKYHCKNKNDITIVTAIKSFKIPYGVIETGKDGLMQGLSEKPELTYMINTGVYILQPELIGEIPENEFYHITQLIEKVRSKGGKVGCFPVSENSWSDMGEWSEYLKMVKI